jgi:hypothetical protein
LSTGVSDEVKCFFCGGGLKDWEPGESPWDEHAKWYPTCDFLRIMKGDVFIAQVQEKLRIANDMKVLPFSKPEEEDAAAEDAPEQEEPEQHVEGKACCSLVGT